MWWLSDWFRATLRTVIAVLALAGCATPPTDPAARAAYEEANDPLEPMNRSIFSANETLQRYALDPVARTYRDTLASALTPTSTRSVRSCALMASAAAGTLARF